jgi:hypothetical protein
MEHESGYSQRVAARVREAIKDSGLSNARIAEQSGIAAVTFSRCFRGLAPWNTVQLGAIGDAIAVDPDTAFMMSRPKQAAAS